MVIAQVIGDLRIGGAERLFVDLVNSLEAESAFVVLLNASEVSLDLSDALSTSITVLRAPVRRRTFYVDVPKLAMLLRRLQCDIVHTHTFWSNLYGSAAAALAGVPVIVTSEHGRNEWKRPWHKWAESSVISRFADRRLCVSKDILARRRDIDGVPAQKLVLMPNGTRVPEMSEERHLDRMIIGSVGRLVPEKDFPTLVAAVSGLRKAGHDCYLEIVGEGSARGEIEAAICAEGLSDRVSLVGSQTDVGSWLNRWSIFASSSVQEGQPVALLEAMAHGIPCVATAVGGVPDTLRNGVEGIIVKSANAEDLAGALEKLIENSDLRLSLGNAARRRVIEEFSIQSLSRRCMDIYQTVLTSKRKTS